MTDNPNYSDESQPPPPPPSQPPPGAGGPVGGAPRGGFDADAATAAFKGADRMDLGIIGAGVLAFIFSFFPYYTASVHGIGGGSGSAWHGFFGWFAALVALAAAILLALPLLGVKLSLPVPTRLAVLVGFAVATVCVLLALLVWPGKVSGVGIDYGHGFGYWASVIVIVAGLVLCVLRRDANE
jgi:hypothetical protein